MDTRAKPIVYWVMTAMIASETFAGGLIDLAHGRSGVFFGEPVVDVVTSLGFPVYVLLILGVWKLGGALTLVLPKLPRLKEWAYAGIIFELTGAGASQVIERHSAGDIATPWILAAIAIASWALRPAARTLPARTATAV